MEPEGNKSRPNLSGVSIDPELEKWFNTVDTNHSGHISKTELRAALINYQGRMFSEQTCNLLMKIFDTDNDEAISAIEFYQFYTYLNQWAAVFAAYDKDNSGYIEKAELLKALDQMGYSLSEQFVNILFNDCKSANNVGMSLDEFILNCVKIQKLTDAFRERDTNMQGVISIGFEELLSVILERCL